MYHLALCLTYAPTEHERFMMIYTHYITPTLEQKISQAHGDLPGTTATDLDHLLELVVFKTIAQFLEPAARLQAVSMYRADPTRLIQWVDQTYPSARIAIVEALTRTLLSLTVE